MQISEVNEVILKFVKYALPFVAAAIINRILTKAMDRDKLKGQLHLRLLRSILRIVVWAGAVIVAISFIPSVSRTWETVLASSGIMAVVLGLAAQSTLANMFAGIAMTVTQTRPFDIGDRIQVGTNDPGFVMDITLRHVAIRTFQNEIIYLPNSVVGSSTIINFTKMTEYSYPITVTIAYGSDVELAMRLMCRVISSHPAYKGDGNVAILCRDLADSGIVLRGMMTTSHFVENPGACSDCRVQILKRFAEEGIEIPFPQMDVHIKDSPVPPESLTEQI